MNFKKWKFGLAVAILSGVFTGLIGLGVGMTSKQIIILMLINIGKDGLLYLQQTKIETISFDTTYERKDVAGLAVTQLSTATTTSPTETTKV